MMCQHWFDQCDIPIRGITIKCVGSYWKDVLALVL